MTLTNPTNSVNTCMEVNTYNKERNEARKKEMRLEHQRQLHERSHDRVHNYTEV